MSFLSNATDQLTSSIMLAAAGWLGSSPFATFLLSSLWWSKSLCLICLVILCVLTWPHLSETSPGLNWHMVWLGVIAQYSGNPGFVVLSDLSFLLHFKASLQSLHPTGVPLQLPPNEEEKQFPLTMTTTIVTHAGNAMFILLALVNRHSLRFII